MPRRRRRRRRSAGRVLISGGGPRRGSTRTGPSRRSLPFRLRSTPSARPTLPGPDASRRIRDRRAASPARELDPLVEGQRADEDGLRLRPRSGDDVQAVMEPVDQVDVEVARRAEHDRVSGRLTPRGVGRQVLGTAVGLDLHDPATHAPLRRFTDEPAAEQIDRKTGGRAVEPGRLEGECGVRPSPVIRGERRSRQEGRDA